MKKKKEKRQKLTDLLSTLKDPRRGQGKMHALDHLLLIMIMAIMSGYGGQRAMGNFVQKNEKELRKTLKIKRLPSYPTIGRVMRTVDYAQLTEIFFTWARTLVEINSGDWISADGKAINGTVTDQNSAAQNFTNLITFFQSARKQIVTQGKINNKESEIPKVQNMMKVLGMTGLVVTADALHCQKKTIQAIVESGNDYVIGVKDNQKNLHNQLKKMQMRSLHFQHIPPQKRTVGEAN